MNIKLNTKSGLLTVVLYMLFSVIVTVFTTIFFGHGGKTAATRIIEDWIDQSMWANIVVAGVMVLVTLFVFRANTEDIYFEKKRESFSWFFYLFPLVWVGIIVVFIFTANLSAYSISSIFLLLLATLAIGINEEVATRGILLTGLRNDQRPEWLVWLISTLVFALLHLVNLFGGGESITQVVVVFFGGTFFYIFRRLSGNLFASILAHMLFDTAVVLMIGDTLLDANLPDHVLDVQLASFLVMVLTVVLFLIFGRKMFRTSVDESLEPGIQN